MAKHLSLIFLSFILVLAALISGSVFLRTNDDVTKEAPRKDEIVYTAEAQEPAKESSVEVPSPDEKYILTMKNVSKKDGTISQTLSVYSEKEAKTTQIYQTVSPKDSEIVIPFNTFSPNDRYVFLKINKPDNPEYIVLRTDGQDIKNGEKTAEITKLFYEKYSDLEITDITGWGGYTFIVVNANDTEGKAVPSFWFDAANITFRQLSTRFN